MGADQTVRCSNRQTRTWSRPDANGARTPVFASARTSNQDPTPATTSELAASNSVRGLDGGTLPDGSPSMGFNQGVIRVTQMWMDN